MGSNLVAGRPPNAVDWVRATGRGRILRRSEPSLVEFELALPPRVPPPFARSRRYVAPGEYVVDLPNAWVCGTDGMVITEDGCLLEDLGRAGHVSIDSHPVWTQAAGPCMNLQGTAAVVASRGAHANISHFLADTIPRIGLLLDTGEPIDTWIVSGTATDWQRLALALALPEGAKVIAMDRTHLVRAERLLVPSRTGFAIATAPWARSRANTALTVPTHQRTRRILISRAKASGRRLVNEREVAEALRPAGFEVVAYEDLPFDQQLRLTASAETIIGVHGAALGHLIASPPGGRLIEIVNPAQPHLEYWSIAALARWKYHPVLAEAPNKTCDPAYCDVRVPLDELLAVVAALDEPQVLEPDLRDG